MMKRKRIHTVNEIRVLPRVQHYRTATKHTPPSVLREAIVADAAVDISVRVVCDSGVLCWLLLLVMSDAS